MGARSGSSACMDNVENNEATNNEVGNTTIFTFIAPLWGDGGEVINPPTGGGGSKVVEL